MEKLSLFLRRALWAGFLLLILGGVFLGTVANFEHLSYCAAFAVSCAVTACLMLYKSRSEKIQRAECAETYTSADIPTGGKKKEAIILAVLCFAVNGGYVVLFHPVQAPDYQTFLEESLVTFVVGLLVVERTLCAG